MKPILTLFALLSCLWTLSGEETVPISIHCPSDQQLTCTAPTFDLSIYGEAYLLTNGVQQPAGPAQVVRNTNGCNVGTIIRTWQTKDENFNTIECSQKLTLVPGNFNVTNIHWPEKEYHLEGCDNLAIPDSLPPEYRGPTFDYVQCSNVGTSYNDVPYDFGPDCRKIIREWSVIDWCTYNPGQPGGIWRYSQVFKVSNGGVPPVLNCPKDLTINPTRCDSAAVTIPFATASGFPCSQNYVIKNLSPHADTCTYDASGVYPLGESLIYYELEYGCGEKLSCRTKLHVNKIIAPVPYCLATLNVALMAADTDGNGTVDDGMVELWAKDLDVGSYHPCYDTPLTFSFDTTGVEMARTFTCAEVGHNDINIYVTDKHNRQSYCKVDIHVQNNGAQIPDCEPVIINNMTVAGMVTDPYGLALSEVIVSHRDKEAMHTILPSGESNTYQNIYTAVSDQSGAFSAANLLLGRGYEIKAYKRGQTHLVDQTDLNLLDKHIKGEAPFASPYTYLAADINEDGLVSIADYHMLKNLLGKSEDDWPNQKQWLFFRKASMGAMSTRPSLNELQQYIEMIELRQNDEPDLDFIGILKGDISFYES